MKTNYLAVVVCAVVYWLLGGLWYGLLFSKQWMALENMTEAQARSMNVALPYVITFILNLLISYVLAQLCLWRNANTAGRGAAIGVLLWVGIGACGRKSPPEGQFSRGLAFGSPIAFSVNGAWGKPVNAAAGFGSASGNRTRILALKGPRANRCTIAPQV